MEQKNKRDLWLIRAFYFVNFGAFGFTFPFMNLFYERQGLSGIQIGVLIMVGALVSILVSPILGALGGQNRNPVRMMQAALFFLIIIQALISQQTNMLIIGFLVALNSFVFAGYFPLSISVAQEISFRALGQAGFGGVRLFGSLGWAAVTVGSGWIVETFGIRSIFVGYIGMAVLGIIFLGLIRYRASSGDTISDEKKEALTIVVRRMFKDRALLGFAISVFILHLSLAGIRQFETLYMDDLGAPERIIGWAFTLAAVVEIPFMMWADPLMSRINSTNVLRISFGLEIIRLFLLALFPSIPMILVGRALGGVAYAFFIIALVQFLLERAEKGQNNTLQALFNIAIPNLAAVIISPIIGSIFDAYGGYAMYPIGLVGTLVVMIVFFATVRGKRSRLVESVTK